MGQMHFLLLLSVVDLLPSTTTMLSALAATATFGLIPRTHPSSLIAWASVRRLSIRPTTTAVVTLLTPSAASTLVASNGRKRNNNEVLLADKNLRKPRIMGVTTHT